MKKVLAATTCLLFFSLFLLSTASHALDEGDQAPPFTAQSTQGEISLEDFAGQKHVVLALYFAVFTSV